MTSDQAASAPMKVLMVTRETEADRRYGLGKSLLPIVNALSGLGHEVGYLCRAQRSSRSADLTARVLRLLAPLARWVGGPDSDSEAVLGAFLERLDMGRLAWKVARRDGYSHVHLHDPWMAIGFRLARQASFGGHRCRWGITEHGFGCYAFAVHEDGGRQSTRLARLLRRFERCVTLAANWVISPTHAAQAQLARDLAIHPPPPTWRVIHHARPEPSCMDRATARERLGWSPSDFYVLGVGRLASLKRFDLLIRAAARVRSDRDLRLVILGGGRPIGCNR